MREYYRTHPEYRKYVAKCSLKSYHKNPERSKEYSRLYRIKNPHKARERQQRWRNKNREWTNQWHREWRLKNIEKIRERDKVYWKNAVARNPDKAKAKSRRNSRTYRLKNPKKCNQRIAEWGKRNPQKRADYLHRRRARLNGGRIDNTAPAFYAFVRSKKSIPCYYCGKSISGKSAHIDHVIAISKHGNHASNNLCASCPECNFSKGNRSPSEITTSNQPLLNL